MLRFLRSEKFLIGLGLTIHIVFLFSLSNDWLRSFFYDSSHTRRGFDFGIFYLAGKAVLENKSIYDVTGAFGYRYLPLFAHSFGQIYAKFSFSTAYFIHITISELFLLANIYLTTRWATNKIIRARAVFFWLGFSPYFLELYMGQVSFWASSVLFFMLGSIRKQNFFGAGVFWSIAILIKPNTLLIAPAFVFLKRWYMLIGSIFFIIVVCVPFFYFDSGSINHFLAINLTPTQFKGALTHAGNVGLIGLLISISAKTSNFPLSELSNLTQLPLWSSILIYSVIVIFFVINLFVAKNSFPKHPELHISLWITTFFLIYKDVWEHHYVFILPVITFLYLLHEKKILLLIYLIIALPTPFILLDIQSGQYGPIDPERSWKIFESVIHRSSKIIPILILWLWILRRMVMKN